MDVGKTAVERTPDPVKGKGSKRFGSLKSLSYEGEGVFSSDNTRMKLESASNPKNLLDSHIETSVEADDINELREAIIELYLAIKIRSTEELDKITDDILEDEKKKLD